MACDDTNDFLKKNFAVHNIPDTLENRNRFRTLIFTTPNIKDYISGIIINQEMLDDNKNSNILNQLYTQEIMVGLKVDKGFCSYDSKEFLTEGMDGLEATLRNAREQGCSFVKWRCIFKVSDNLPSPTVLELNCNSIAR